MKFDLIHSGLGPAQLRWRIGFLKTSLSIPARFSPATFPSLVNFFGTLEESIRWFRKPRYSSRSSFRVVSPSARIDNVYYSVFPNAGSLPDRHKLSQPKFAVFVDAKRPLWSRHDEQLCLHPLIVLAPFLKHYCEAIPECRSRPYLHLSGPPTCLFRGWLRPPLRETG